MSQKSNLFWRPSVLSALAIIWISVELMTGGKYRHELMLFGTILGLTAGFGIEQSVMPNSE